MGLLSSLVVVQNPHHYEAINYGWYWSVGFLSLAYLGYIEKSRRIPFRFLESIEPKWYYGVYFGIAFGLSFIISVTLGSILRQMGFPAFYLVVRSSNDVLGIACYAGTVAISEESFKVALTNLFTRACGVRRKSTERLLVMSAGTMSVALWAYLHMLVGGHNVSFATIAFVVGMAYFLIIYSSQNFLPTTIGHAFWNAAVDSGLLIFLAEFLSRH